MWSDRENDLVVKTLGVVLEVTATELSPAAAKLVVGQLQRYRAKAVVEALHRCAQECKFRLTLADVLERMPTPALASTARQLPPPCSPEQIAENRSRLKSLMSRIAGELPAPEPGKNVPHWTEKTEREG